MPFDKACSLWLSGAVEEERRFLLSVFSLTNSTHSFLSYLLAMPSVEIARSNSMSSEDDKITPVDKLDSSYQLESAGEEPVKRHWFRSTAFQGPSLLLFKSLLLKAEELRYCSSLPAIVTGSCSLLSPGLWNAVNATGGGGAQEPFLVNAGNALVFGLMVSFRKPKRGSSPS